MPEKNYVSTDDEAIILASANDLVIVMKKRWSAGRYDKVEQYNGEGESNKLKTKIVDKRGQKKLPST